MPNEEMDRRALPQSPDVATRKILIAVGGYLGFVGLAMVAIFFYVKADAPAAFKLPIERQFPQPGLQTAPDQDLANALQSERSALSRYSWIDRGRGVARIPIEKAVEIVIARGDRGYDPLDKSNAPEVENIKGAQP
jgi:hypothetical protein